MLSAEAQAFLERLKRAKVKPLSSRSLEDARQYVAWQAKTALKKQPSLLKVTDIVLSHTPPEISRAPIKTPLRFYRPLARLEQKLPLILYFHGGGFSMGNCDYTDGLCQMLALQCEALVVSVDYRLAPEYPYPHALYEGLGVLKTLFMHHEEYRFNPDHITLMGDSAGANIAAVITNLARGEVPLYAQILVYPVVDFSQDYPSHSEFEQGYFLNKADMDWARKLYLQDLSQAVNPLASPIFNQNLQGLPKTLIMSAQCDPLRDEARAYAGHLIRFGTDVTYEEYKGEIHCFLTFPDQFPQAAQLGLNHISAFLQIK